MIELIKPRVPNFVKYCLSAGATVKDLVIPTTDAKWPGLCNPSIFNDNGRLQLVLRNVNYVMHASYFDNNNWSSWGPLQYIIPDFDRDGGYLKTRNYICEINDDCKIIDFNLVNTSKYDKKPKWEFVGHEDARLVRWDGKLYMSGVRRDDNPTGIGRMSLCAIDNKYNEISRKKIDGPELGYCEKNWMAITDMPYHYVRLTLPTTEIVEVDPRTGNYKTVLTKEQNAIVDHDMMIRGSSQVIPWKDGKHIALTHTCNLVLNETNKKYARYHFHFVVWDEDWNIEAVSPLFTFNDFNVEFSNGLAIKDGYFYIPFALQDNMSFILKANESIIESFIYGNPVEQINQTSENPVFNFFMNDKDVDSLCNLAIEYYNDEFKAGAYCLYQRALDFLPESEKSTKYNIQFMLARSIADLGSRDDNELEMWWRLIDIDPTRPEGWMAIHMFYKYRGMYNESYHFAKLAFDRSFNNQFYYDKAWYEIEYITSMLYTSNRDYAIQYIENHPENEILINISDEIIKSQQEVTRIL